MSDEALFKTPPHSTESEQSVLGGLMLDNETIEDVSLVVNEFDFFSKQHQVIYSAIYELHNQHKPFDIVAVVAHLEATGKIDDAGGKAYLMDLIANTPGAVNILYYSQTVRDKSILRSLIQTSNEIGETCYFPQGKEVRDILDFAESQVMGIAEHGQGKQREYKTMETLLDSAVTKIDELFNSDGTITGLPTHLNEFDEVTSGLQKGDLIIVAGRPSMGKTTFSMNLAENAATKSGASIGVFSMEMPGEQLAMRMLSSIGRIDAHRMRTGQFKSEDWPKLHTAVSTLSRCDVMIDDSPALPINELRARARRMDKDLRDKQLKRAREEGHENPESQVTGLGLLVVDYLQLMRGSINTDNRVNEISEISRGLKALAKELNVPLIALSQLNRSLEQRPDKRPKMADLRESGAIEQDADLIIFIYRDEVYNPDSEHRGTAEIILGKHRNGPLANVRLTFIGEYTKFENHTPMDMSDQAF